MYFYTKRLDTNSQTSLCHVYIGIKAILVSAISAFCLVLVTSVSHYNTNFNCGFQQPPFIDENISLGMRLTVNTVGITTIDV